MSGPQLTDVFLGDSPASWRRCGFDVDDTGAIALGSTTLRCTGEGEPFQGWSFRGATSRQDPAIDRPADGAIDGLTIVTGVDRPSTTTAHPNGIVSIDHVVVRTGDCTRTVSAFESAGFEVRGGRSTSSYGSPMRQVFMWAGDVILELVGPDLDEPTTDEPTSIFGFALVAADLHASKEYLGELLSDPKPAVQPGREIAGLRSRNEGISLPVAVMSPHPPSTSTGAAHT